MVANLEALLASGQDSAQLRFTLASKYFEAGELDRALEHGRVVLELSPDYSAGWRLLGQILSSAGAGDEAAAAFREGIAVAERRGDRQVAKEMRVFLRRLERSGH
jgi:Tfp pilus assembly protein PilF